jgi:hypothetical protein
VYPDNPTYDFEAIRARLLSGPRITSLMPAFERIASGAAQRPHVRVTADPRFLQSDEEFNAYHDVLQRNFGTFLHHGCASIPFLLEELIRVGVAIVRLARARRETLRYYETSSADGTAARTLAEYADGRIHTLTDSPNPANASVFQSLCGHAYSHFYEGSFADVTPALIDERYPSLSGGFDVIWENTTFQMYGAFRDEQLAYVRRLLKPNGLMLFLEKMKHDDPAEYARRESIKDREFKARYFSAAEIVAKKSEIIETMERGQVTLDEFTRVAHRHFEHVVLIWNSANFYQIAASNDAATMDAFLSHLRPPFVPGSFAVEPVGALVP